MDSLLPRVSLLGLLVPLVPLAPPTLLPPTAMASLPPTSLPLQPLLPAAPLLVLLCVLLPLLCPTPASTSVVTGVLRLSLTSRIKTVARPLTTTAPRTLLLASRTLAGPAL